MLCGSEKRPEDDQEISLWFVFSLSFLPDTAFLLKPSLHSTQTFSTFTDLERNRKGTYFSVMWKTSNFLLTDPFWCGF